MVLTAQAIHKQISGTASKAWMRYGDAALVTGEGNAAFGKPYHGEPGSETGLVSVDAYNDVELSFDVLLRRNTWFIAKIHQLDQMDQRTNSYHIVSGPGGSYLAKHNTILSFLRIRRGGWQHLMFRWVDQLLEVLVNNAGAIRIHENQLQSGFCFLGVKGGHAEVRNIRLNPASGRPERKITHSFPRNSNIIHPEPGKAPWPFTATPRRNLIYHVWPVRESIWQWNLDQLKSRLDLFNGRRIMGITYDDRSESPEAVQDYFQGHGFEFVIQKNDGRGEAITFPLMMEKAVSHDPNEVTFYGHAKGVRHGRSITLPVRRWCEVQYRVALDNWPAVRDHLQQWAMTGPFKMLGRFQSHQNLADWHYSGTYFWMRNAHVFSRNYQNVPQFYGGVETWPGIMFRRDETACLFMDNLRELPYNEQFWRGAGESAFKNWESSMRCVPAPPDLVCPVPYKGHSFPRIEQKPEEFQWWVAWLLKMDVSRVLTIGSKDGGAEWHLAREFFEHGRKIEITSIDIAASPQLTHTLSDAAHRFQQSSRLIKADSTSASVSGQLANHYDAVFIDGDHSYRACRSDFMLAKSLKPRLVGFHDIIDSDWHASVRCCVSRLWTELANQYRTERNASGDWGGIGVVILDS
jgi:hypothetical protein